MSTLTAIPSSCSSIQVVKDEYIDGRHIISKNNLRAFAMGERLLMSTINIAHDHIFDLTRDRIICYLFDRRISIDTTNFTILENYRLRDSTPNIIKWFKPEFQKILLKQLL